MMLIHCVCSKLRVFGCCQVERLISTEGNLFLVGLEMCHLGRNDDCSNVAAPSNIGKNYSGQVEKTKHFLKPLFGKSLFLSTWIQVGPGFRQADPKCLKYA